MSALGPPEPPEGVDDSFQQIGSHSARVDGDVIWLRPVGALGLDDLVQVFALGYGVGERYGYILFLCDARHASPPTAEARRYQLEQNKRRSFPSHTAIYGASLVVRTMVTLTQRAIELLTGEPPPLSFVKDEAAARARLDLARADLARQVK